MSFFIWYIYFQILIVQNEQQRRKERINCAKENNVWTYRNAPPKEWNSELPEKLERNVVPPLKDDLQKNSSCVLS